MTDHFPTFKHLGDEITRIAAVPSTWPLTQRLVATLDRRHSKLLTLGWMQYVALVGLLTGLMTIVWIVAPGNPISAWYWMNVVGPTQETRYGFRARLGASDFWCLEVNRIEPNGAFDQAGVKEGWAFWGQSCLGYHESQIVFRQLRDADAGTVQLQFISGGCQRPRGRDVVVQKVTIVVPKGAG
jgi:hypothetical protein